MDIICYSQNNATGGARFALRADDLSGTGYQKQSQARGRTAEPAHLCTFMPASNTDFSISQMHYGYQSSINATCDRFTRFDFGM